MPSKPFSRGLRNYRLQTKRFLSRQKCFYMTETSTVCLNVISCTMSCTLLHRKLLTSLFRRQTETTVEIESDGHVRVNFIVNYFQVDFAISVSF